MALLSLRDAVRLALREALLADQRVFIMGQDVGAYGGVYGVTRGLLAEFGPARIIDTPCSEAGVVGAGIGAALAGLRPVIEIMQADFALLALDQLVNHAAKLRYLSGGQLSLPLVLRLANGSGLGLGAQHSQSLEAWLAAVPGLKVVAPSNAYDARGLLAAALQDDNPVVCIEPAVAYDRVAEVPEAPYTLPLGRAHVARAGNDVTLIVYGEAVGTALAAAATLSLGGIEAEVIDLRTLRPLDEDALVASVARTGRAVMVEQAWRSSGLGGPIAALLQERCFERLQAPVGRVAGADLPMPYAEPLERAALPTVEIVVSAVESLF